MKNRLVSALLVSLVVSLSLAVACSGGGSSRRGRGNNNTIKLDGSTNLTSVDGGNSSPDLKKPPTSPKPDLAGGGGSADLTCQEFFSCLVDCSATDAACSDDCLNKTSPAGQSQFEDLFNCLANACVAKGDCQLNDTQDGLVSSPACSTCLNADATWTSCDTQANACL